MRQNSWIHYSYDITRDVASKIISIHFPKCFVCSGRDTDDSVFSADLVVIVFSEKGKRVGLVKPFLSALDTQSNITSFWERDIFSYPHATQCPDVPIFPQFPRLQTLSTPLFSGGNGSQIPTQHWNSDSK